MSHRADRSNRGDKSNRGGSSNRRGASNRGSREDDRSTWPRPQPYPASIDAGGVYFIPFEGYVPKNSIIHHQKSQSGFFFHPCLVVDVDSHYAYFLGLTSFPPQAILELGWCFRLGNSPTDTGDNVLQLAPGSPPMTGETWANLETIFKIEKEYLQDWMIPVKVDKKELGKVLTMIQKLESQQNRYLYKPLIRDLSTVRPGTVLMLRNGPMASTFGAPILVIQNDGRRITYHRIKRLGEVDLTKPAPRNEDDRNHGRHAFSRRRAMAILRAPAPRPDGVPDLILEPTSPEMREPSYVEIKNPQNANIREFRTWCYPNIMITEASFQDLLRYAASIQSRHRNQNRPQVTGLETTALVTHASRRSSGLPPRPTAGPYGPGHPNPQQSYPAPPPGFGQQPYANTIGYGQPSQVMPPGTELTRYTSTGYTQPGLTFSFREGFSVAPPTNPYLSQGMGRPMVAPGTENPYTGRYTPAPSAVYQRPPSRPPSTVPSRPSSTLNPAAPAFEAPSSTAPGAAGGASSSNAGPSRNRWDTGLRRPDDDDDDEEEQPVTFRY